MSFFLSPKRAVPVIFLLALLVRLAWLAAVPPRSMNADDSQEWNRSAVLFMNGQGFLSGTETWDPKRPPLYPLFLASVYRASGIENFTAVKITQSFLNSITCVLFYAAALVLLGEAAAFLAGLFAAFYIPSVIYCGILQSETFFTFWLALLVLLLTYAVKNDKGWSWYAGTGIVLGFLNLTRGTMLLFPIFLVLAALLFNETRKNILKFLLAALVSIIVISPWTWRNYKVYRTFMPIVSGGPELMWFGTIPISSQKVYGDAPEYKALSIPQGPKEFDKFFARLAVQNIKDHPISYAGLTAKKFFYFWFKPVGHEILSGRSALLGKMHALIHASLILLFLAGVWSTAPLWKDLFPIYAVITYFACFHIALMPMPRFRLPIEPLFLIFVAYALLELWRRRRGSAA